MSVSKLLKEQEAWINSASKNIDSRKASLRDLEFPEALNKKRQREIQGRIKSLKVERDIKVKQFDAAIKEQEEELEQLKKELDLGGRGGDSGRTPGVIVDGRRPIVTPAPGRVVTPTPKRTKSAKKAIKKATGKKSSLKTKTRRRSKKSG